MNTETEVTTTAEDKMPSADWVRAVSDFLDTGIKVSKKGGLAWRTNKQQKQTAWY